MGFSALEMIVVQYFVFSAGETSDNFKGYHRHDTGLLAPVNYIIVLFLLQTGLCSTYVTTHAQVTMTTKRDRGRGGGGGLEFYGLKTC